VKEGIGEPYSLISGVSNVFHEIAINFSEMAFKAALPAAAVRRRKRDVLSRI